MPYIMSAERIGMEKGMEKGQISEAREMVLKALDTKFRKKVPADVYKTINIVNNRLLLKDLLGSAILSKDLESFRKILQEIPPEQMQKQ
ncbi:MAG: hypothetical protein R6U68_02175 [Desulfobacteraceae bacterium]